MKTQKISVVVEFTFDDDGFLVTGNAARQISSTIVAPGLKYVPEDASRFEVNGGGHWNTHEVGTAVARAVDEAFEKGEFV